MLIKSKKKKRKWKFALCVMLCLVVGDGMWIIVCMVVSENGMHNLHIQNYLNTTYYTMYMCMYVCMRGTNH